MLVVNQDSYQKNILLVKTLKEDDALSGTMATKKYKYDLKCDPESLFEILKRRADEKGWPLSGNAQSGSFSDPDGLVSGTYEVRGKTAFVTIDCSIPFAWGKIERELDGFFG